VLVNYQHGMRRYIEILRADRPRRVEMALATALSAKAAVPRVVAPRREVHRSQRVARQKIAQQKGVQQKLPRIAFSPAKVCTGNWVNAACAVP
jgi:ribosomal protein L15E